ncbi:outer membrane protein assembly factor BamB family protein [Glycomyces arizonensis]|uniref:outer membrane protein assembly factor BamB family protein n=1 Tax=Glycomyces arizonensis TaxID=256035 RepID=UPI00041C7F64|nr:PQQ-binding-like beta-propeller repeat protein [Glycomyces arizonensis]
MYDERRDPHGMWRELRSWPLYVQIGVAAVAVGSLVLAFALPAIMRPSRSGEADWPDGEIKGVNNTITVDEGSTESEPEPPESVSVYDGEPLWSYRLDADSGAVTQVDQGTLVRTDGSLRLIADDETVWEHTWEDYAPEIGVAGEVVVISGEGSEDVLEDDEPWPGRQDTVALDLGTGEEVWHDEESSFVTVFSDAVMMTECTGEQDDHIGDCTLYARDPVDLSTLWSTPTYASARVVSGSSWTGEAAPERLVVESFPTGHDSRTVTVYENGDSLGSVPTQASVDLAGDTMLVYDDWDDNPADGCTAAVTAYRLGESEPAWEAAVATRKSGDLSSCGDLPAITAYDGKLPLTVENTPAVVDVATGEAVWTAPAEGQAYALSPDGGTLIATDWESEEDNLVAYDIGTGEERWRATADVGSQSQATVIGSTLWIHGDASMWGWSDYNVIAYNLDTGEGVALPGSVSAFAPGEIIMTDDDYETPELTAWPVDLWS